MHMRNQKRRVFRVLLKHLDGYQFQSQASEDGRAHGPRFLSDEPDPIGDAAAPSTPALLGAAVGHCLSASLLEALKHAHVDVRGMETDVASVVAPNSEGLPRVHHIDVVIRPLLAAPSARVHRCEEVFERHCTVTSSVRLGIDIGVQVQWRYDAASEAGPAAASATAVPPNG